MSDFDTWWDDPHTCEGADTPLGFAKAGWDAGFAAGRASVENEFLKAIYDQTTTGTGVLKDGKRIDPKDIYEAAPSQEPAGCDWAWCFENPKEAAKCIDDAAAQIAELTVERNDYRNCCARQMDDLEYAEEQIVKLEAELASYRKMTGIA